MAGRKSERLLVSVGWVTVAEGRLLGVRTRGRDVFYLPGGKPEPGEDLMTAVVREVREELDLELVDVAPAFVVEAPAHGQVPAATVRMTCFTGRATGRPTACGEIEELAWLGPADRERAAPALQHVLDRVLPGP